MCDKETKGPRTLRCGGSSQHQHQYLCITRYSTTHWQVAAIVIYSVAGCNDLPCFQSTTTPPLECISSELLTPSSRFVDIIWSTFGSPDAICPALSRSSEEASYSLLSHYWSMKQAYFLMNISDVVSERHYSKIRLFLGENHCYSVCRQCLFDLSFMQTDLLPDWDLLPLPWTRSMIGSDDALVNILF